MKTVRMIGATFALTCGATLSHGSWTIETPTGGAVGTGTILAGNRSPQNFAASAGVSTFSLDTVDGAPVTDVAQPNLNNNPGRLNRTNYYGTGLGFRADIGGAGTSGFSLLGTGSSFVVSGDNALLTNRSQMTFDIRSRETTADRKVQAVAFNLKSFGALGGGYVEFFSGAANTSPITIDALAANPTRLVIPSSPTNTIFVGYDAGSEIISGFRVVTLNASGVELGEQYGLDNLSISRSAIIVPEPSAIVIGSVAGIALLRRRRPAC